MLAMTSNLKGLFELALPLQSPWFIEEVLFDEKSRQLTIKIDFHRGSEFFYKDEALGISGKYPVYDTVEKQWRHLNFFEHECYLHARVPRVQTPDGQVRLIQAPWAGQRNGFTLLFEALALSLLEVMPVHRVGQLLHLSDYKLWSLLDTYITLTRAREDYSKVTQVGMDETAKRKHHDYVTLFVDMNERKTLFITEGRSHATVKAFSEDLIAHHAEPAQISEVSCDMSPAFIKGVQDYLPNANITFDKFHIIKIINEAVDTVRKQEVREQPKLRGQRFIFLKNRENLTQKQKEVLTIFSLAKQKLKTLRALQMREAFQDIYQAPSVEAFEHLLKKWCGWAHRSRLLPMKMVAQMLKNRWDGVVRWKTSQINNGILEGLNSLIQAAKAKARGYKTFRCMQLITYLLTAKLDFTVLNKYHLPT
jgi:transposase